MLPVIQFIGFTIPTGLLFAVFAFVLGSELGARSLGRAAPPNLRTQWRDAFGTGSFMALAAGLVGARLGYALKYLPLYLTAPGMLLSIRPGTLAPIPGLLVAGVVLIVYLHRRRVPLALIADAAAIGVVAGLIVWYVGQFFTGADYGTPTVLPWGVELWGTARHPVQIYAAVLQAAILIFLWRYQATALPGATFWLAVALLGLETLLLDAFRADVQTWIGGIRVGQASALAVMLAALYVLSFYVRRREARHAAVSSTVHE
jgi:phosphatidylglycerol:prolipoprotein diacylglycerol transferase